MPAKARSAAEVASAPLILMDASFRWHDKWGILDEKKGGTWGTAYMLNSGQAIHAQYTVPEHTKRGVVAQVLFCESSHP